MKKLILFASICLLVVTQVFAQNGGKTSVLEFTYATDDKSLLWEITGKGIKEPSYLYGTVHIKDKRVFQFDDRVQQAFDACEAYAMEILFDQINPMAAMRLTMMTDSTLDMLMSAEDYKLVQAEIQERMGLPEAMYKRMKPFFLGAEVLASGGEDEMPAPLDLHFDNLAKKQEKIRLSIERFEMQAEIINKIPLREQANMLITAIKDGAAAKEGFDELVEVYLNADLEGLLEYTEDDPTMNEALVEDLLDKRNPRMASTIAKYSKEQTTFNAVGAAHLGGEKGVIALLRNAGYTVKPIATTFKKSPKE